MTKWIPLPQQNILPTGGASFLIISAYDLTKAITLACQNTSICNADKILVKCYSQASDWRLMNRSRNCKD